MLVIVFIIISIRYYYSLKKSKSVALESGVSKDDYDLLHIGLWFYIIPPMLGFFFPSLFKLYLLPFLMLAYAPSIYYGTKISGKLDRGYDYVRKLGKTVSQIVWIGYAGIGLVILNWILINSNSLVK